MTWKRLCPERKLRQNTSFFCQFPIKLLMLLWVADVHTISKHRKAFTSRFQHCLLGNSIDSSCHPAYYLYLTGRQLPGDLRCKMSSVSTAAACAHDCCCWDMRIRKSSFYKQPMRIVIDISQFFRICLHTAADKPYALHPELMLFFFKIPCAPALEKLLLLYDI